MTALHFSQRAVGAPNEAYDFGTESFKLELFTNLKAYNGGKKCHSTTNLA